MSETESPWTAEELRVRHDTYFHHFVLAQNCVLANRGDTPRFMAHCDVRDYCAKRMGETLLEVQHTRTENQSDAARDPSVGGGSQ